MKKLFTITDKNNENQVDIEIDADILTDDLAHEVNNFWSGAAGRLAHFDDQDIYPCVAALAAQRAMQLMLDAGGAIFDDAAAGPAALWTNDLLREEGMPGPGTLRIVGAYVTPLDFFDLEVHEG